LLDPRHDAVAQILAVGVDVDEAGPLEVTGICFWGPRNDRAAGQPRTPARPDALPRGRPSRPGQAAPPECGEYPATRTRLSRGTMEEIRDCWHAWSAPLADGDPARGARPPLGHRVRAS
jgi:hypothetical protein